MEFTDIFHIMIVEGGGETMKGAWGGVNGDDKNKIKYNLRRNKINISESRSLTDLISILDR